MHLPEYKIKESQRDGTSTPKDESTVFEPLLTLVDLICFKDIF